MYEGALVSTSQLQLPTSPEPWAPEPDATQTLDAAFLDVLRALMCRRISAHEAVAQWERICFEEAARLQDRALAHAHIPASATKFSRQAHDLWEECCTWKLVRCMFCSEEPEVGPSPLRAAHANPRKREAARPLLQQLLQEVDRDPHLRRLAQVLTWAEATAAEAQQLAGGGAAAVGGSLQQEYFAPALLLWQETLAQARGGAVALDPDACYRDGFEGMATGDVQEQGRLLRSLFRLLRCGRADEAALLAADSGAAWRGAALLGGGAGVLPFAAPSPMGGIAALDAGAAEDADGGGDDALAADVLVSQGEEAALATGARPCAQRSLWRGACAAVAQAAAQHADGAAAHAELARWEAAVYGVLAGGVEEVLPVCEGWGDEVWARARTLLQVLPEEALSLASQGSAPRKRSWDIAALFGARGGAQAPAQGCTPAQAAASFLADVAAPAGELSEQQQLQQCLLRAAFQRLNPAAAEQGGMDTDDEAQGSAVLELAQRVALFVHGDGADRAQAFAASRFAAHLSLALVALGVAPRAPERTTRLWHETDGSAEGRALELFNEALDAHINALVDTGAHALVPRAAALLRGTLARATLRRYLVSLTPALAEEEVAAAAAESRLLRDARAARAAGAHFKAEPPAAPLAQLLADGEAWAGCAASLAAMVDCFQPQALDDAAAHAPHLPQAEVQFDGLLCSTVARVAQGGVLCSVAALKWLLLPYLSRRHMREPFQSLAGDRMAVLCWACALQAVFSTLELCRSACLDGPAACWRAFAWLQHLRSSRYAALTAAAPGAAPLAIADAPSSPSAPPEAHADFFSRVLERASVCITGTDVPETLSAAQAAVYELDEWHQLFAVQDSLACMERAVVTGCAGFLLPEAVAATLEAAAECGACDTFHAACVVPAGSEVALELHVVRRLGGACDLWGGADGEGTVAGTARAAALALIDSVSGALEERARGVGGVTVEVALADVSEEPVDVPLDTMHADDERGDDDAGASYAVCVRWRVGAQREADVEAGAASPHDAVVTAAADMLRGDLLPAGSEGSAPLRVVAVACSPRLRPRERAVPASAALSSIHKAHALGRAGGRFEMLRALCAHLQRAAVFAQSRELELWAAQAGALPDTAAATDEGALELMSGQQLHRVMQAEQLKLLHVHAGR